MIRDSEVLWVLPKSFQSREFDTGPAFYLARSFCIHNTRGPHDPDGFVLSFRKFVSSLLWGLVPWGVNDAAAIQRDLILPRHVAASFGPWAYSEALCSRNRSGATSLEELSQTLPWYWPGRIFHPDVGAIPDFSAVCTGFYVDFHGEVFMVEASSNSEISIRSRCLSFERLRKGAQKIGTAGRLIQINRAELKKIFDAKGRGE